MGNASARYAREFHCLHPRIRDMHFIDKPSSYGAYLCIGNLAHQMRYSVKLLEEELVAAGKPHVLQLALKGGDDKNPEHWELHADGHCVADGSGEFVRELFFDRARAFLDLCRDAVAAAELPDWSEHEYRLLCAARGIAAV